METNIYQLFKSHKAVTTDSRNCPKGALFFALKGENFDGNQYAEKALEAGCSYAIIDNEKYAKDERYIVVKDGLKALQNLANKHRKELGTKIIGITGTNGKTTTKELIASVLKQKFNVLFTEENLNNHIGVPLTLLRLNTSHSIAVVEMGASGKQEISELCNIAEPDYGIITNVGEAHLEGFGSFEGVKKAKAELYDYLFSQKRPIFINRGNPYLVEMATQSGFVSNQNILSYQMGKQLDNHIAIAKKTVGKMCKIVVDCVTQEGEFQLTSQMFGKYNAENILTAVTIGKYFDLKNKEVKKGIESYVPTNNRSECLKTNFNQIRLDAYNANPTSMTKSITDFIHTDANNKILILGDMLELGVESRQKHQEIIYLIEDSLIEEVYLVGSEFGKTKRPKTMKTYRNTDKLIQYIINNPIKNGAILVKASRGIGLEKIKQYL